jgi:hypothetical protein
VDADRSYPMSAQRRRVPTTTDRCHRAACRDEAPELFLPVPGHWIGGSDRALRPAPGPGAAASGS